MEKSFQGTADIYHLMQGSSNFHILHHISLKLSLDHFSDLSAFSQLNTFSWFTKNKKSFKIVTNETLNITFNINISTIPLYCTTDHQTYVYMQSTGLISLLQLIARNAICTLTLAWNYNEVVQDQAKCIKQHFIMFLLTAYCVEKQVKAYKYCQYNYMYRLSHRFQHTSVIIWI